MLISTETLGRHLGDPGWVVFDCRHDLFDAGKGERAYGEGHVPGAVFVPVETVLSGPKLGRNGRHPLPRWEDFAEFLNRQGVTMASQVVAYDDAGGQYAARFWWLARTLGHPRTAVLDGGWPKWTAEGRAVATSAPPARPRGDMAARPDAARWAEVAEVQGNLATRAALVIDARAPERFRGETEPIDPVAGHIPGAVNHFFKHNLNPDLTMRSPAELRPAFEALLGGRRPEAVLHQCGSGVTACLNLLAMERAGLTGSRLYVGSWSEWIADPARPVARGS
ncbi:MAG: sulfurtransferase [Opitutaceae bacterium]|nr:sulfurtransferase [Opitutaceae bacterium]